VSDVAHKAQTPCICDLTGGSPTRDDCPAHGLPTHPDAEGLLLRAEDAEAEWLRNSTTATTREQYRARGWDCLMLIRDLVAALSAPQAAPDSPALVNLDEHLDELGNAKHDDECHVCERLNRQSPCPAAPDDVDAGEQIQREVQEALEWFAGPPTGSSLSYLHGNVLAAEVRRLRSRVPAAPQAAPPEDAELAQLRERLTKLSGTTYSAAYDAQGDYKDLAEDAIALAARLRAGQPAGGPG